MSPGVSRSYTGSHHDQYDLGWIQTEMVAKCMAAAAAAVHPCMLNIKFWHHNWYHRAWSQMRDNVPCENGMQISCFVLHVS